MLSPFIRSRSGMALLNVIMLVVLVGAMVIAGYKLVGPLVQRGKINETKTTINSAVDAIISWSVARGHIPGTVTEFNEASVNQYDAWGRKLRYLYDSNLAAVSTTNAICNFPKTNLTVNGVTDIAFAVLSLGDDYDAQSQWNGTLLTNNDNTYMYASPLFSPTSTPIEATLSSPDIFRIITLNELKARIGCAGYTWGQLRILNNELPKVCSSATNYTAQLFGYGGDSDHYSWSTLSIGWSIDSSTGQLSKSSLPSDGETVTVTLDDNRNPSVSRTYKIAVISCTGRWVPGFPTTPGWGGSDPTTSTGITGGGVTATTPNGSQNTTSCYWNQTSQTLQNKTLRAFFNFKFATIDTYADSTQWGDGFTFTLMQGSNAPITNYPAGVCGATGAGEYIGFYGLPMVGTTHYSGNSLGIEFDTYPNTGRNDPTRNHIAVVKGGSVLTGANNTHGAAITGMGSNPACNGTDPGCAYPGTVTWLENGATHNARVEVINNTNCLNGTTPGTTLVKAWVDCSTTSPDCRILTSNYSTAPTISHCLTLPVTMDSIVYGFTEATGSKTQNLLISNFAISFSPTTCPAFTGWSSNLPQAYNCSDYTGSTTITGGESPFTWALSAGILPNGISFCDGNTSSSCTLAGSNLLAYPGTYTFTQQVVDNCRISPQNTSQSFSITVNDACYTNGVQLLNNTGNTRWYRRNSTGACQTWSNGSTISVGPGDINNGLRIFSSSTRCNNNVNTCATTDYCGQKAIDNSNNCNTTMTNTCAFGDI